MHRRRQAMDAGADDDVVRVVGKAVVMWAGSRRSSSSARSAARSVESASHGLLDPRRARARRAPARRRRNICGVSSSSASGFSGLPRARAGSETSVRPSVSAMRTRAQRSAGKRRGKIGILGQRHRSLQPRHARIGELRRAHFGGADVAEHQRGRDGKRQAVLRFLGRRGHRARRPERDRFAEAFDRQRGDVVRREAMRALQRERRLDRRLRPAAHRIRLEVLLADAPASCRDRPRRRARRRARS